MLKKLSIVFLLLVSVTIYGTPINLIAAENFYGDVAKQIGGRYISVTNILTSTRQDPHIFKNDPALEQAFKKANLIVYNGLGYDDWIKQLLNKNSPPQSEIIVVANLLKKKNLENPHIWYDPETMPLYAKALVAHFSKLDPSHRDYFQNRFEKFIRSSQKLLKQIHQMKSLYQGIAVIATEPVFNEMAAALGLVVHGKNFQMSIMRDQTPSATEIADFEEKIKSKTVKLLIYNDQVTDKITKKMRSLAKKNNIPVLGVNEILPSRQDYQMWISKELIELDNILSSAAHKQT